MKNICFLNSIKFWGGGEKLHLENAIEFNRKKYKVVVASNPNSILWEKCFTNNIELTPVRVGNISFLNLYKLLRFAFYLRVSKIDTIVFSSSQDLKFGAIAAKIAGVERVVYLRGLASPIRANFLNRFIFKSCLTHIIASSNETKRQILTYLDSYIPNEKVYTIYHGVELNENLTEKLDIITNNSKGIVLGNAGRLIKQKRQSDLIKIAKKLKESGLEFTLFIAGEGDCRNELEEEIAKYKLNDYVKLLSFVSDMSAFMSSIDIFLQTSESEGFGFVLVEAMMKSKPVLAYNVSSNPEIIEDGKSGYLIEFGNTDSFADKLAILISDHKLREAIGKEGLRRVKEKFILLDRINEFESYLLKKD